MFKAIPYFVFQDANAAIAYYEENFDAKLLSKQTAEDPAFDDMDSMIENRAKFIMHATIEIMGQQFYISTSWGNKPTPNEDTSVALVFDENDEKAAEAAKTFFDKASSSGSNVQPFGEAPWTKHFGSFTDRFGVNWMVSGM